MHIKPGPDPPGHPGPAAKSPPGRLQSPKSQRGSPEGGPKGAPGVRLPRDTRTPIQAINRLRNEHQTDRRAKHDPNNHLDHMGASSKILIKFQK